MDRTWMIRPRGARGPGAVWCALLLCAACKTGGDDAPGRSQDRSGAQENGSSAEPGRAPESAQEIDPPKISVAANHAGARAPMDATPSPDGSRVYFTALQRDAEGDDVPAIFTTGAGGGEIEVLASGDPLEAPVSISISLDGQTLFIADTAASTRGSGGALLSLPVQGGMPAIVSGTEGYVPSGIVVARVGKTEQLYFAGRDPGGRGGVFRVGAGGGAVEPLAASSEFVAPSAVTVDNEGTAYVVDALGDVERASLLRVRDGNVATLLDGFAVGFPAGVALDMSGSKVFVSGLDPKSGHDAVYVVEVDSGKVSVLSKPFAGFTESAGLHRAHDSNVFAWADSEANGSGTVYTLSSM